MNNCNNEAWSSVKYVEIATVVASMSSHSITRRTAMSGTNEAKWQRCVQWKERQLVFNGSLPSGHHYTGLSKKMDGIWNRCNLKSTGRTYTFRVLKCSEEFKVLDLTLVNL